MSTTLYILLGYPGAGKTTASKIIYELTGAVHLWADYERRARFKEPTHSHDEHIELYAALNKQAEQLLQDGKSVIYDTNFSFYKDRQLMRSIANQTGSAITLLCIDTPRHVAKDRATNNAHTQGTRVLGDMSEEDFDRIAGNMEPPRSDEPYIELDGTQLTKDYIAQKLGL